MRKSRVADFGACAICRLVSMRKTSTGSINSSGPPADISRFANSTPLWGHSAVASQRCAASLQLIAIPPAAAAFVPFALNTIFNVIGNRDELAFSPTGPWSNRVSL